MHSIDGSRTGHLRYHTQSNTDSFAGPVFSKTRGAHATKKARMRRISSPGTQEFPGNSPFQLFQKCSPISSLYRKKGVISGEGQKETSPGGPCTTFSKSTQIIQAFGQSFSVIFTPHNRSNGRAERECLSYVDRFQLICHLFTPSLVSSCSRPSNIGNPPLLCTL